MGKKLHSLRQAVQLSIQDQTHDPNREVWMSIAMSHSIESKRSDEDGIHESQAIEENMEIDTPKSKN